MARSLELVQESAGGPSEQLEFIDKKFTERQRNMMRKFTHLAIAIGAGLSFGATAQADDLRFTTLPQTVQTTVIRETRIPDASGVTRIVRDSSGIYAVTVRGHSRRTNGLRE
jgi:hypothetical protein